MIEEVIALDMLYACLFAHSQFFELVEEFKACRITVLIGCFQFYCHLYCRYEVRTLSCALHESILQNIGT